MDAVYSALPGLALLELADTLPKHADAQRWRDAVRLYLDEYVAPMCRRSAYRILPYGLFTGSPTPFYVGVVQWLNANDMGTGSQSNDLEVSALGQ